MHHEEQTLVSILMIWAIAINKRELLKSIKTFLNIYPDNNFAKKWLLIIQKKNETKD